MPYKRHRILLEVASILLLCLFSSNCKAQRLAVHTNAVSWGVLSPNLGIELALSRHSSVSIEASALPWNINDKYSVSHITVSPDYKYWFTMPFFGHFAGINALYSSYNQIKQGTEKTGNLVALGATYGYAFLLNRRWNIVPTIGLGGGLDLSDNSCKFVAVPTRIGVNIQMVIK